MKKQKYREYKIESGLNEGLSKAKNNHIKENCEIKQQEILLDNNQHNNEEIAANEVLFNLNAANGN